MRLAYKGLEYLKYILNNDNLWTTEVKNMKTIYFPNILGQSANPVQSVIQVQSSLTKIIKDTGNERIRTGINSDLIFRF